MTLRVCAEPRCPTLGKDIRCTEHQREREQARGSSTARGYDYAHQQRRAVWQARLDQGEIVHCWRCQTKGALTRIDPTSWTLGHCDDDRSAYHGPECPPCDYATVGRGKCPHPSHIAP